jgi:hypothetical protein
MRISRSSGSRTCKSTALAVAAARSSGPVKQGIVVIQDSGAKFVPASCESVSDLQHLTFFSTVGQK